MTELCGPAGPPTGGRCPDPQAIQTMDPILLIHPPVAKAGEPPAGIALLAAALGAGTLRWDARQARTDDMNADGRPDLDHRQIGDEDD